MMVICLLTLVVLPIALWAVPHLYRNAVHNRIDRVKHQWAFDKIPISKMRKLLQRHEPSQWITTNEERKFYNEIAPVVTVFRGGSMLEQHTEYGISWTTSRPVACFFAFRHTTENRAVFMTVVPKSKIRAVFTEREEKECLLIEPTNVEMVTTKPTEYYDQYQKFRYDYDQMEKGLLAKVKEQWSDLLESNIYTSSK